jgi:hypothetical protein
LTIFSLSSGYDIDDGIGCFGDSKKCILINIRIYGYPGNLFRQDTGNRSKRIKYGPLGPHRKINVIILVAA